MREKTVILRYPNPVRPDSLESDPPKSLFPTTIYSGTALVFP